MLDLFYPPKIEQKKRYQYATPRYSVSRKKLTPEEFRAKKAAWKRAERARKRNDVSQ